MIDFMLHLPSIFCGNRTNFILPPSLSLSVKVATSDRCPILPTSGKSSSSSTGGNANAFGGSAGAGDGIESQN